MGVLDNLDLDNIPEMGVLDAGEYEVQIMSAEDYVGKTSGKQSIRVILGIPSEPTSDDIFHYVALPSDADDERGRVRKLRRLKEFLTAFGLSTNMELSDWLGAKAWALVAVEKDQNGEDRNTVKKFIGGAAAPYVKEKFDTVIPF